jgi:hypothetical protein
MEEECHGHLVPVLSTSIGTVLCSEWSSRFTALSVSEWPPEHIPGTRDCDKVSFEGLQGEIRQHLPYLR